MLQRVKALIISAGLFALFAVPVVVPATVLAQESAPNIQNKLCQGTSLDIENESDCSDTDASVTGFQGLITTIINIFSLIVGVIAVIFIIIGGLKYITSGGDSNNITSAKNTILYALVGLIIVALAQVVVRFVLNRATTVG